MKEIKTYEVKLYIGLKEGYEGWIRNIDEVYKICQDYCDEVGLCVTVTPTKFVYTKGNEPGAIVGLINYPRFPAKPGEIDQHAANLATMLMPPLCQKRCTIVTPKRTIMIEQDDLKDEK